jgi:ATP-binding cassette subfamily B (MDR/TAP) protein 9
MSIIVLGFMFYVNFRLTLITLVTVPLVIVMSDTYGKYVRKISRATQEAVADANNIAEEVISSMRNVRSFANEEGELTRYREKMQTAYALNKMEANAYVGWAISFTMLPQLATAAVLYCGGNLVLNQDITGGDLVSFLLYQNSLSESLNSLGWVFSNFGAAMGAADKVFELIDREPKHLIPGHAMIRSHEFRGELELRNVSFSYPGRPEAMVFQDFNLRVRPGEVVAIVGPSGGGKSSVVNLIQRFYDPTIGRVLLDGKDLHEYDPAWLHCAIGIVGQEPTLYARSIADNIRYGMYGYVSTFCCVVDGNSFVSLAVDRC